MPNGFFFGDEARGFQTQVDSVWDVAVSPDWKWIGFGRAYAIVGGEGTGTDLLTDVARRTSIDTATLRAGSFASSGMSMSRAIAQPGVIRIPDDPRQVAAGDSAAPRLFPIARGWQVRWTTDGKTLALGNSPARASDDEPSQTWSALDPVTGALSVALPSSARLAEVKMTPGPTLDRSLPIDMTLSPPPILVNRGKDTYSIYSTRGVITITDPPGVEPPAARGRSESWVRGSRWRRLRADGTSSRSRLGARPMRTKWRLSRWSILSSGKTELQLKTTGRGLSAGRLSAAG